MLWAFWPRWMAGKVLPLLGVMLLRKKEKMGSQWSHWQVKYLIFPGKCVDWGCLGVQFPVKTEASCGKGGRGRIGFGPGLGPICFRQHGGA